MLQAPPLPAPFPAVVKLLPESQPEPKPSSVAQEHFSCWWDWIQISPCCSPFFSPSSYAWERLALPLCDAACAGQSSEYARLGHGGVWTSSAGLDQAEGIMRQGRGQKSPGHYSSKTLGKERTGGGQERGTQGQLQPEPPAVGPHGGSWGSRCLLDPTELPSLLNV